MAKEIRIGGGWKERLAEEFEKPYFQELTDFVFLYPPQLISLLKSRRYTA